MTTSAPAIPPEPLHFRGHIAGLDALRGAAVLGVLLCHAYSTTTDWTTWHGLAAAWIALTLAGHLGVHLFFLLSGFLITGILLDRKADPRPGRARDFYSHRARRILPAYLLMLAILWAAHVIDAPFLLAALFFVANMGRIVGAHLSQYGVVWSLAVEEQFYLLWPWFIWRCSPRTTLRLILAALILSPMLRLALALHGADTYFKTYSNVDYLMYGALLATTLRTGQLHAGNIRRIARWLYLAGLGGIALWFALISLFPGRWIPVVFLSIGRTPYMALFAALLLSSLVANQRAGDGRELSRAGSLLRRAPARALAFFGYISYGLYLLHKFVFRLYDTHVADTGLGGFQHSFALLTLRALICGTVATLLALLSRSTYEAWFLRRNQAHAPVPASDTHAPRRNEVEG